MTCQHYTTKVRHYEYETYTLYQEVCIYCGEVILEWRVDKK